MRRKIASGAGLASRKPSASWALSSSAASRAGASSRSNGSPGRIACGRSCKPSNRGCVGGCINRFLSKENGWDRSSRATSTITPCRPTVRRLLRSASWSPNSGNDRSGGAVRTMVRLGSGSRGWPKTGSPNRSSFIHGRKYASPSRTQVVSRMRESRLYGSVRGALSNERPYRDRCARNDDPDVPFLKGAADVEALRLVNRNILRRVQLHLTRFSRRLATQELVLRSVDQSAY